MKRFTFAPARLRSLSAVFTVGIVSVLSSGTALASQSFPGAMQEYLEGTPGGAPLCPPTCTLCHTSPAGGVETVRETGFTQNIRDQSALAYMMRNMTGPRPLSAAEPSTVGPALQALEKLDCFNSPDTNVCDSDMDGMADVEELRKGRDPDGPGLLAECPQYGCGASVAPVAARPYEVPGAWLVAALGALVFVRRRR
jgi:MYXO-CTERM domain-containing protein